MQTTILTSFSFQQFVNRMISSTWTWFANRKSTSLHKKWRYYAAMHILEADFDLPLPLRFIANLKVQQRSILFQFRAVTNKILKNKSRMFQNDRVKVSAIEQIFMESKCIVCSSFSSTTRITVFLTANACAARFCHANYVWCYLARWRSQNYTIKRYPLNF